MAAASKGLLVGLTEFCVQRAEQITAVRNLLSVVVYTVLDHCTLRNLILEYILPRQIPSFGMSIGAYVRITSLFRTACIFIFFKFFFAIRQLIGQDTKQVE